MLDRDMSDEHDAAEREEAHDDVSFASLGLNTQLTEALAALGYEEPTPIQAESIPEMLAGHDVLGQAATGTGKTAAFALPILQRLAEERADADEAATKRNGPLAVVLVPTRELAIQVSEAIWRYGRGLGARVVALYGGQPIFRQLQTLVAGRRHRRRHARSGPGPPPAQLAGHQSGVRSSCSTRPTRCSTWASPRTSRRCSSACPPSARPCCSRPRCRRASSRSPASTSRTRCASASPRRRPRPARPRRSARWPTWSPGRTRPQRSVGCSTSRRPPRRSCSAGRASRSTSSPRRSSPAATAPRRCTAG